MELSTEDGAGRAVKRLDAIANKIREHGTSGIAPEALRAWARRKLGLRVDRIDEYLSVLERCREVFFDPQKRRYYHVEAKP